MNYISTNWNPLKSTLFSRHIDDLFDDGDLFFKKQRGLSSSWNPATDVLEDENSFIIETELPRLNKKDITIEVNDSILKFSGEKLQTKLDEKQKIHQRESFHAVFQNPSNCQNQLLSIRLKRNLKTGC